MTFFLCQTQLTSLSFFSNFSFYHSYCLAISSTILCQGYKRTLMVNYFRFVFIYVIISDVKQIFSINYHEHEVICIKLIDLLLFPPKHLSLKLALHCYVINKTIFSLCPEFQMVQIAFYLPVKNGIFRTSLCLNKISLANYLIFG